MHFFFKGIVVSVGFRFERLHDGKAVFEVFVSGVVARGAHRLDIQPDVFAAAAVAVLLQDLDLIEGLAQVFRAEAPVFVEFQAVLVVEVDAEQLVEGEGKAHLVGGVEAREHGVRRFEQPAHAGRVLRCRRNAHHVAERAAEAPVDGLVGLGFDGDADGLIVIEHGVDRFDDAFGADDGALALRAKRPFAGEPQHDEVCAQLPRDVDGAEGAPQGELSVFLAVGGEAAVHAVGIHPQAGRDEFRFEADFIQKRPYFARFRFDFLFREFVDVRHGIVVVELHGVKAELFELSDLFLHGDLAAGGGAVYIRARRDVPRTYRKFEWHIVSPCPAILRDCFLILLYCRFLRLKRLMLVRY